MKKILKNVLGFGIGFLILLYLFYQLGFEKIYFLLIGIRIEYFLLAALFYFFTDVIAAIVLKVAIGTKISLREILPSHMCGMFYSAVTPGRIGYYYTAFSLSKKTKESRSGNVGILTLLQGIYFFIKVFLSLLAVLYFSRFVINTESQLYLITVSLLPILFVATIFLTLYTKIINQILAKLPLLNKLLKYITLMQEACRKINLMKLGKIVALGSIGWITMSTQWFLIANSLNLEVTFLDALMLQPILTTIMFVPLSPGGLGFTEGGSGLIFTLLLNQSLELALASGATFILLIRLNSILVDSLGLIDMRIHGKS